MKLNIGGGYKRYHGFKNVDNDPHCNPDILVNLDDVNLVLPIEDNTVTHVLAEHILEHIGDGFFRLLQELYRICKHGAIIDILVPHPFHEAFLADPTHKRPILVETFRLFSKTKNLNDIASGGRSSTLAIHHGVDFEVVAYDYVHDGFYDQMKKNAPYPVLERLFREAVNTTLEIKIKLMVVKDGTH